jgi:hypothetical protein
VEQDGELFPGNHPVAMHVCIADHELYVFEAELIPEDLLKVLNLTKTETETETERERERH